MNKSIIFSFLGLIIFGTAFIVDLIMEDNIIFVDEFLLGFATTIFLIIFLFQFESFKKMWSVIYTVLRKYNTIIKIIVLLIFFTIVFLLVKESTNVNQDKLLRENNPWNSLTEFEEKQITTLINNFNSMSYREKTDYINNFEFGDNCLVIVDYCIGEDLIGCEACDEIIQKYRPWRDEEMYRYK